MGDLNNKNSRKINISQKKLSVITEFGFGYEAALEVNFD